MGLSQTAFAELGGVTKSAQIKWERGTSAPTASALSAFSEAGADVLYILTGKRLGSPPGTIETYWRDEIGEIERQLIEPSKVRLPDENDEQLEARVLANARDRLSDFLSYDAPNCSDTELVEWASNLLEAANQPPRLALLRAADFAVSRQLREDEKELLSIWLQSGPYQPDHSVMEMMARLALEHKVSHRALAELAHAIYHDIQEQRWADGVIETHDGTSQ